MAHYTWPRNQHTDPGGGLYTGPGGGLSIGPGGGLSTEPSGGLSIGPGGGCTLDRHLNLIAATSLHGQYLSKNSK
jgi:hypothetical protein